MTNQTNLNHAEGSNNSDMNTTKLGAEAQAETSGTKVPNLTQRIRKATSPYIMKLLLAAGAYEMTTGLSSCTPTEVVKPIEQVNPNAFTDKEIALFKPRPDGSVPSFTVDIGDPKDPYFMPKLFKMEMRLIDAKTGTYEITPIISKKVLEEVLTKADNDSPSPNGPIAGISLVIKKADGTSFSPTSTFGIRLKDDNNPATDEPNLSQLPDNFTFDYLLKFSPLNTATMKKTYTLNKTEELQLWIESRSVGKVFTTVKLPTKPVEQLAVVTSN